MRFPATPYHNVIVKSEFAWFKQSTSGREQFVLLDRSVAISLFDQVVASCQSAGFSPAIVSSPDLMATVLTLVAAGQGVSLVPEGVQNLRSRQVAFIPVSPAVNPVPLIACWNTNDSSPPRDAFLQLVRDRIETIRKEFVIPRDGQVDIAS